MSPGDLQPVWFHGMSYWMNLPSTVKQTISGISLGYALLKTALFKDHMFGDIFLPTDKSFAVQVMMGVKRNISHLLQKMRDDWFKQTCTTLIKPSGM